MGLVSSHKNQLDKLIFQFLQFTDLIENAASIQETI